MPKIMQLKSEYLKADIIKIRFNKVNRFYRVSREKLVTLQKEGKLSPTVVNAMFEEVKTPTTNVKSATKTDEKTTK